MVFSIFLLKMSFFTFSYNECFDTSFKNWAAPAVWVYSWVLSPGETEETWFWCQPRVGSSTGDSSRADALTSRTEAKTVTLAHLTLDLGHLEDVIRIWEGAFPSANLSGKHLRWPTQWVSLFLRSSWTHSSWQPRLTIEEVRDYPDGGIAPHGDLIQEF